MNTKLKKSVYMVSSALALNFGGHAVAFAQQAAEARSQDAVAVPDLTAAQPAPEPKQVQVLVTGSRISRRDTETSGPMLTMTREDMKFAAPTSVGDMLQAMPNAGVSLNSNGTQGTSYGVSAINLRYLGSAEGSGNRTLVLVDGRRWVSAAGGRGFRDFVDLNTIPLGMIDSIEVLKDGASAIYGADAIAGVVNVHTKSRLEGFEANVRAGATSHGDNDGVSGYLNWGKRMEKARVLLSASFTDTNPIRTEDRELTRVARTPLTGPGNSPRGLYTLPGLSNNAYFGTPAGFAQNSANAITRNVGVGMPGQGAGADNSYHVAQLPGDYYNQQTQGIYATGPAENLGLFGRLSYEINDSTTATVEAVYSNRKSVQMFSPFLLDVRGSNGYSISNDHLYNPFGTANGVPAQNALGFAGSAFRIQRIPTEVGNRENIQKVEMSRVVLGLKGSANLFGEWQYDTALSHSHNEGRFTQLNQINFNNVYQALTSPATCAAAPGCTPLNLFGVITPEMADYIRYTGNEVNGTRQTDFTFNASRELMELPGGPLGMAAGYEYRRESAYDRPDPFVGTPSTVLPRVAGAGQPATSAPGRDPTTGGYDLHEAYVEFRAPLLANLPLINKLEIDAAMRYSDYSTVGSKATSKVGLLYKPTKDLLLRSTYSQGFRAPSILELYQGQRETNFPTVDPCNGGGAGRVGCAGVPASYHQSQFNGGLTAGVVAGNPNLKPESADTYAIGFSYSPEFAKGLSFTADKFRIKVTDAIAAQTGTQILQTCAASGMFCDLVQRGASGEVVRLTQAVVNLSRIEVAGIDGVVRYTFPALGGKIDSALDVAYLQHYRSFVPQPDGSVVVDDRTGKSDQPRSTFPRYKGQASLRYLGAQWTAGWKGRYIGSSADIPNNAVNGGKVSATLYHDVQLAYTLTGGTSVAVGVDNVADRQPPASAANNPINFDIYTYDVRGRYLYARVNTRF